MHEKQKTQALAGEYTSQSRSATSPFGKTSLTHWNLRNDSLQSSHALFLDSCLPSFENGSLLS